MLVAAMSLALVACEASAPAPPARETDAAQTTASSTTEPALEPIETLEGEWRVAGIDGEAWDESSGLALSADAQEIWWEPRCAAYIQGYTIDGLRIEIGPRVTDPPLATDMPPPVCAIGLPPRLTEVFQALQTAETVGRTPENGVLLEGGGRSLLLFSQ